jgi:hypothetical protein
MRRLPMDPDRPYVVPWFVAWIDGKPDFRIIREGGIEEAHGLGLCWLCGQPLGAYRAFVIGPMCAVNRVAAEPPSHRECAEYAARVCPFLTRPNMRRRDTGKPDYAINPAGIAITRNPGVALVWVVKKYQRFSDSNGGFLFDVGEPVETLWYAEGRSATRDEVMASIDSGLPLLRDMAEQEGPRALTQLDQMHRAALELVPSA